MTNFSFLQSNKDFAPFVSPAIAAEQILHIDPRRMYLKLPALPGGGRQVDVFGGLRAEGRWGRAVGGADGL